jgi:hypothetical protein
MTDLISKDIVDLQDIEKIQYLQTLQSDPAKYSNYVQGKTTRILSETVDARRAAFTKAAGDMARLMDMDHNSLVALGRTQDLANTQDQIITTQRSEERNITSNEQLARRQVEINNYYYENKRETLFLLQLVLLIMLTVTVILSLTSYGFITQDASDYILLAVVLVGGATWLYRWYYTTTIRDPKFWNRRTFEQDGSLAPPSGEICIGADGESQPVTQQ